MQIGDTVVDHHALKRNSRASGVYVVVMDALGNLGHGDTAVEITIQVQVIRRDFAEFLVELHHDVERLAYDFLVVVDALVLAD